MELVVVVERKTNVFKERAMRRSNQRVIFLIGSRRMGARRTKRRGKRSDEIRINRVELIIRRGREGFDRNVVRMSAITKRGELKNRGEKARFIVVTFEKHIAKTMRKDEGVQTLNNLWKRKANRSASEDEAVDMVNTIGMRLAIDETIEFTGSFDEKME